MYSTQNGFSFGGYQQPNYQQNYQQPSYTVQQVTSREEMLAAQIDFMGLGGLFPDRGHGVVYIKRFNPMTGTSDVEEYWRDGCKPAPPRDELGEIRNVVAQLQKDVEALKGGAVSE